MDDIWDVPECYHLTNLAFHPAVIYKTICTGSHGHSVNLSALELPRKKSEVKFWQLYQASLSQNDVLLAGIDLIDKLAKYVFKFSKTEFILSWFIVKSVIVCG